MHALACFGIINKFWTNWRDMQDQRILECYANYIKQTFLQKNGNAQADALPLDPSAVLRQAWLDHPDRAARVIEMFACKFSPQSGDATDLLAVFMQEASEPEWVDFLPMIQAIYHTVRTNFYCDNAQALAIKMMHGTGVIEIFMDHPVFQGVMLKGAMIARGGLRWSDREDFRTECWQLMQTQVLKNTIIVPSGSKGAFFLKIQNTPPLQAYKFFVEGLLDISDNLEKGIIIAPKNVRCYDGNDFYNVVAADKGTSSFSDFGNEIALRRGYWLGDAFASGGSNGYNHKKLAITSRGAWVSVRHHLERLSYSKDRPLRVIGIGDMAGDVFGNGMLEESNIHLLGAFNHEAIFVDPTPNADASYRERCRLFHLAGSKWSNYQDFSLGGAVYSRTQESIDLSPQVCAWLGLADRKITPDALIRELLQAPADLLWLGGIGTFIQAEGEKGVLDAANRDIRVLGKNVRAKIIAEGANLGMTQAGRIEYAVHGGCLNTDAIDNCAGVNCSDHEINIKILLDMMLRKGDISSQERRNILQTITEEVCALVLKENAWQNIALSVACQGDAATIMDHALQFAQICLQKSGDADPVLQDLQHHLGLGKSQGRAVTRPEMAVILSYAKRHLKDALSAMDLSGFGNEEGVRYFPRLIQERFSGFLQDHLLFSAIKTTMLTNRLIDVFGPMSLFLCAENKNVPLMDVLEVFLHLDGEIHGHRMAQKIEGSMSDLEDMMQWIGLYQGVIHLGLAQWVESGETRMADKHKAHTFVFNTDIWQKYQHALAVVTKSPLHV